MLVERRFARPHAQPVELSAVLGCRPGGRPLASHRLADGEFRGRHEDVWRLWVGWSRVGLQVRVAASGLFRGLVGQFVAGTLGQSPAVQVARYGGRKGPHVAVQRFCALSCGGEVLATSHQAH